MTNQLELPTTPEDKARFLASFEIKQDSGHWLWVGDMDQGQPLFTLNGHTYKACEIAWVQAFGPISPGYRLSHACNVTNCLNPHHLYTVPDPSPLDLRVDQALASEVRVRAKFACLIGALAARLGLMEETDNPYRDRKHTIWDSEALELFNHSRQRELEKMQKEAQNSPINP